MQTQRQVPCELTLVSISPNDAVTCLKEQAEAGFAGNTIRPHSKRDNPKRFCSYINKYER